MSHYRQFRAAACGAALLTFAAGAPLAAQSFPNVGGIEVRGGMVSPENTKTGFATGADLDLGFLGIPSLRTLAGVNYWNADIDRAGLTGPVTAIGGRAGLRLEILPLARLVPFVQATLNAHDVSTDFAESSIAGQDLEGFTVGAGLGAGISWALDSAQRTRVVIEADQVFINNFNYWGVSAGLRFTPRGTGSYESPVAVADYRQAAAEAERLRRVQAEQLEAERSRAAGAQLSAEQQRTEAARLEADRLRAEQAQQAQVSEAARLRAEQEIAAARAAAADTLAAARAAAERATAAARAETEAAQAAAREAQDRAAAAERRAYEALLDLDRLIGNITSIRETERGLVLVLGQGLFATGQSSLSAQARSEVGRIAAVLQQYPDNRIAVEGHTDAVGSEVSNQRLSEQRAEAVRAALIASGADPLRIDMAGYGEGSPIGDNETAAGRAENRRVEIIILGARRPAPAGTATP